MAQVQKPACLVPWISIWPRPDGQVFPCCASEGDAARVGNLKEQSLKEVFHGDKMNQLRKSFMAGQMDEKICARCIIREKSQGSSLRTMIDEQYGHFAEEALAKTNAEGECEDFKLRFVDFVWSNKCNFKCVHCSPHSSSSIASVPEMRSFYYYEGSSIKSISTVNGKVMPELLQGIEHAQTIHFNGGEPFIIDEHYEILDHLIRVGNTEVKLWFHTNGSVLGSNGRNIVDYLKHFKNKRISLSHDGVGERGAYVRQGYNDKKFLENAQVLKAIGCDLAPALSVHALNAWHATDIIDWYYEHGLVGEKKYWISVNLVTSPRFIRFDIHDRKTRVRIADKIEDWLAATRLNLEPAVRGRLDSIQKSMREKGDRKPNSTDGDRLKMYLEHKNRLFGQDAIATFPEYKDFFKQIRYAG